MKFFRNRHAKILPTALLCVLFLCHVVTVGAATVTQYTSYSTTYYNIWYASGNATSLAYAQGIAPYMDKAYKAAYSVIGYDQRDYKNAATGQPSKLNIKFYSADDGAYGYMLSNYNVFANTVYLNTNYLKDLTYAAWGDTVAHETAHILFFNYTKAQNWSSRLTYYTDFLTEALSHFAGDCVYGYADGVNPAGYSQSYIAAQVKFYAAKLGTTYSWYDAGYHYYNATSQDELDFAKWNLRAIGSFLAEDIRTGTSSKLKTLLTTLRNDTGLLSWSPNSTTTSVSHFEAAFKTAYGKYANSAWQYTGSTKAKTDTAYLYADFYKRFYQ
jgi:hypothetical protein